MSKYRRYASAISTTQKWLAKQRCCNHCKQFGVQPRSHNVEPLRLETLHGERSRGDHESEEQMVHSRSVGEGTHDRRVDKALY